MNKEYGSKHFTLEKISNGVYAAIALEGGGAVANAGFVDLGDQTIVFDTFNTQQAAEDLKRIAEKMTGRTVRWVVNSHVHGDHIRGNQVFKESTIVSSRLTYEKMRDIHPERIEKQKKNLDELTEYIQTLKEQFDQEPNEEIEKKISFLSEIEASLPTLELVLPQQTFKKELIFSGTERSAKLFTLGGGHSYCDAMLYVPEERVIFMGDLLFVETAPSTFQESNPEKWAAILNRVIELDFDVAVPGHGPVGEKEDLLKLINYFK